jgi:hypothetical protein
MAGVRRDKAENRANITKMQLRRGGYKLTVHQQPSRSKYGKRRLYYFIPFWRIAGIGFSFRYAQTDAGIRRGLLFGLSS